jgi:hypothetical protein
MSPLEKERKGKRGRKENRSEARENLRVTRSRDSPFGKSKKGKKKRKHLHNQRLKLIFQLPRARRQPMAAKKERGGKKKEKESM